MVQEPGNNEKTERRAKHALPCNQRVSSTCQVQVIDYGCIRNTLHL